MGWQRVDKMPGKLTNFSIEAIMQVINQLMRLMEVKIFSKQHPKGVRCPPMSSDDYECMCLSVAHGFLGAGPN